jgi:hypothetical protein
MFPRAAWPLSDEENSFVASLISDLTDLGYKFLIEDRIVSCSQKMPTSVEQYREFYYKAHGRLHLERLRENVERIVSFEKTFGDSVFLEGKALDVAAIQPKLRAVDLRRKAQPDLRDIEIVAYLRLYQTVGSRRSVGRENVFILEDSGNSNAVMGVLVLASPRYYQQKRDEVLGWPTPSMTKSLLPEERTQAEDRRLYGLKRMMQVSIWCALPPYNHLGVARLLATAPLSDFVRNDYANRWGESDNYDSDLAIVTTSTSMGMTGTPFQNVRCASKMTKDNILIRGSNWNSDGDVYARLGERHPWNRLVELKSKNTFANFRPLLSEATYERAATVLGNVF